MNGSHAIEDAFQAALPYTKLESFIASSREVEYGVRRLQGEYYGSKGYRARREMENAGFALQSVGNIADVFWLGPYRRIFVDSPQYGIPFHSSSTMLLARQEPEAYISRKLTPKLERLIVHVGTILISCSGTIGNTAIVTSEMDGAALTQDAIRVIPHDGIGLLYCFFQSAAGQYLLTTSKSGGVVEHIYEADVSTLRLPILPKTLRTELDRVINESCILRVKANRLLEEAQELMLRMNYLEDISITCSSSALTFVGTLSAVRSGTLERAGHTRLDAAFYNANVGKVIDNVKRCKRWNTLVGSGCEIILLGKTFIPGVVKVEQEWGKPYFTGKELFRARLIPKTFINTPNKAHLQKLSVQKGTTLITCAGTVGRVAYVNGPLEGTAVTHDAIRVCATGELVSGYVYSYLSSAFGQVQLQSASYGSVIPRLHSSHVGSIVIPIPDDGGEAVGELVEAAFECRALAQQQESSAITIFEQAVHRGRSYCEAEWGAEY